MKAKTTKMTIHDVELEQNKNSLPMVGWHNPYADVEIEGEKWEIGIAGGCQKIYLKKPGETIFYSVDIGHIAKCMFAVIREVRKK